MIPTEQKWQYQQKRDDNEGNVGCLIQRVREQISKNDRQRQANGVDDQGADDGGVIGHMSTVAFLTTNLWPTSFKLFSIMLGI
jgi:hypothetical protein